MANSSRKINRGVRVGGKTYTTGMEDELAKVLDTESGARLVEKGYLEGAWTKAKAAEPLHAKPEPSKEDLGDLTVAELKDRAREAEIEGFSTMNKADLVHALSGAKE